MNKYFALISPNTKGSITSSQITLENLSLSRLGAILDRNNQPYQIIDARMDNLSTEQLLVLFDKEYSYFAFSMISGFRRSVGSSALLSTHT